MTGQEILAEEFERAGMRGGYRAEEVDAFLQKVAAYVDEQEAKNKDLTYKIQILADKIEEYKADEENIRDALLNAQKLGASILNEAKAKAENMTREARASADEMLTQAKAKVEALTKESVQKANMELASVKKDCEAEQHRLETIKQEVGAFQASILKQYKAHLDLLSNLPTAEKDSAKAEPSRPAPKPEKVFEEPAVPSFVQPEPEAVPEPEEPVTQDLSEIHAEIAHEEKAQTKEFTSEVHHNRREEPEEPKEEAVSAHRGGRQSYVEKFGELKFGGFNDMEK